MSRPPGPNPSVVEQEVVRSSLNELCAAILRIQNEKDPSQNNHFALNEGWTGAIEVSLKTDVEAAFSPTASLLGPILPGSLVAKGATAGSFTATIGGTGFDQTASSTRDNHHYIVVSSLLSDDALCPSDQRVFYRTQPYQNDGKYLGGELGIYEWLERAVAAQQYSSIVSPLTQVVVVEPPPSGTVVSKRVFVENKLVTPTCAITSTSPRLNKPTGDQNWTTGQKVDFSLNQTDTFIDPQKSNLTYAAGPLPIGLSFDSKSGRFSGTAPSTPQILNMLITATNQLGECAYETFKITIASSATSTNIPKLAYGPTYGATFQFIIKANLQAGPAFTMDKAKLGSGTLLSTTRTETNFVNIALTPTGVTLTELNGGGKMRQFASLPGVEAASVDSAFKRLDDQLQRLSLSHLYSLAP